jgi:glycosyltransferase involved in cell wall biosynthesis
MKISIIIPAFNEERLLQETLQRIGAAMTVFPARHWDTELIVCDNNSTDRTPEIARANGAQVVFEAVNQIARARNTGAAAAAGDWLVFVDADSHPTRELFADVAAAIASGRVLAGGATIRMETAHGLARLANASWNALSRTLRLMAGSFIFVEAATFREIGGFSRELFAGEELDLTQRLKPVARRRKQRIVILHRHPLLTSARKVHLYSQRELFRFFLRATFNPRSTLRSRAGCSPWYDGRR